MDFSNYGLHPDGYWAKRDPGLLERITASRLVENVARAAAAARKAGMLVLHVRNEWRAGHPDLPVHIPVFAPRVGSDVGVEGTWGAQTLEELAPEPGEMTVTKRGISAFAGTELDYLLRLKDVNTVVLTGVATNFVVEGTARDAVDRGYSAVVIKECCQTHSDEAQRFSFEILSYLGSVISLDEFVAAILPA